MKIGNYGFVYIETIRPLADNNGKILKFRPQEKYDNKKGIELHIDGNGEFCKFKLEKAENAGGVYAFVLHDENKPIYIGKTVDLKRQFNTGYGNISPRKCFKSGQITNCKMNKVVLNCYSNGKSIDIYFLKTADCKNIKSELLNELNPIYNAEKN